MSEEELIKIIESLILSGEDAAKTQRYQRAAEIRDEIIEYKAQLEDLLSKK